MASRHTELLPSFNSWRRRLATDDYSQYTKIKIFKPEVDRTTINLYQQFLFPLLSKLRSFPNNNEGAITLANRFLSNQDFYLTNDSTIVNNRESIKVGIHPDTDDWFKPFTLTLTGTPNFKQLLARRYWSTEGRQLPSNINQKISLGDFNLQQLGYRQIKAKIETHFMKLLKHYTQQKVFWFNQGIGQYEIVNWCSWFFPSFDDIQYLKDLTSDEILELDLIIGTQRSLVYGDTREIDACLTMSFRVT